MLAHGELKGYFITECLDHAGYDGWSVGVWETNVSHSYMAKGYSKSAVTIVADSSYVESLAENHGRREGGAKDGMTCHRVCCLRRIGERVQSILDLLVCKPGEENGPDPWNVYWTMQILIVPITAEIIANIVC